MVAARYIAGTELADACRVVGQLNETGRMATIDVLGEEIESLDEARAVAEPVVELEAERGQL